MSGLNGIGAESMSKTVLPAKKHLTRCAYVVKYRYRQHRIMRRRNAAVFSIEKYKKAFVLFAFKAHLIKLPDKVCQPRSSLPKQTSNEVLRSVFQTSILCSSVAELPLNNSKNVLDLCTNRSFFYVPIFSLHRILFKSFFLISQSK